MKFVIACVPAVVAVLLSGCGAGPPVTTMAPTSAPNPATTVAPNPSPATPSPATTDAPTPAPDVAPPTSVGMSWDRHFSSFAAMDASSILTEYDDTSVIAVYNDACQTGQQKVMEYTGREAIKGMFTELFNTLVNVGNVDMPNFTVSYPGVSNPIVEPADESLPATSNVFLVWSAAGQGITAATDTFTWKTGFLVKKQNIVVTEPGATCEATVAPLPGADGPIKNGWDNHFAAFGDKNVTNIMKDYTADSIIRIWDNQKSVFSEHAGLANIQAMFEGLFAAIKAEGTGAGDDYTEGIAVPLISETPEYNSVFLVWESFSNPKATDTFIFDDAGIIVRQNIVTTSKAGSVATFV